MVSGEVKGQHVLLWSVRVFFCLLPAAAINTQCMQLDFPTVLPPESGQDVITIPVEVNQTVTIPFSITDPCTSTQHRKVTITVNKWNHTTNLYQFFCKLVVKENRVDFFPANSERCKDRDDKGHYSFTTFTGLNDHSWRLVVTFGGVILVNKTVQLDVPEIPKSTLPAGDIGSEVTSSRNFSLPETTTGRGRNSTIAKAILIVGISVFSFIVIKLCILLLRRKYRERMRRDCCEGMSSRMRRRRHQPAIRFRRDPPGCESESRSNQLQTDSTHSYEILRVNSPAQPQENEEPLAPPASTPYNPLRSSDYAEYVTDVTLLPSS